MSKTTSAMSDKYAERMVLGRMMTDIDVLNSMIDAHTDSDFDFAEHKAIFGAMQDLYRQNKAIDLHFLSEYLKSTGKIDLAGGLAYLIDISTACGTSADEEAYSEAVKTKALSRSMLSVFGAYSSKIVESPDLPLDHLEEAQKALNQLSQANIKGQAVHISEVMQPNKDGKTYKDIILERMRYFAEHGHPNFEDLGIPTGFVDLDKIVNGFKPGQLIIVAARPSMGKSSFGINIAQHVAMTKNIPVAMFSLEMTAEQVNFRLISSHSNIDGTKIERGECNDFQFDAYFDSAKEVAKIPLWIDEQRDLLIRDLCSRARRLKQVHNVELILVDYLQKVKGSATRRNSDSRHLEVAEVSNTLFNLAGELKIPIICMAQLNRNSANRQNHRPDLPDLAESGAIEKDADIVVFLHRPEYYDPLDKPGITEVLVRKNRNGPIGDVQLIFSKETATFKNAANINQILESINH